MKIKNLMEMAGGQGIEGLVETIYNMAEEQAYNASAEGGQSVTGDQIFAAFQDIMEDVKNIIVSRLEQDM